MTAVVWIGKITGTSVCRGRKLSTEHIEKGTLIFEPVVERIGHKWTMYFVAALQCIALISEFYPISHLTDLAQSRLQLKTGSNFPLVESSPTSVSG